MTGFVVQGHIFLVINFRPQMLSVNLIYIQPRIFLQVVLWHLMKQTII